MTASPAKGGRSGLSLGGKVLLIALVATVLVVSAAEAYRLWAMRQDRLALLVQKAERMADVQAVAMSRPMFDYDREVVAVLVDAMAGDPDVVWASVMGTDGTVFGQLGRDGAAAGGQVVMQRTITYRFRGEESAVGSLVIAFSSDAADRDVQRSMQFSLGGMAAMLVSLSLAITWSVRRITIPLREMTGVLLRLADGDKDVRVGRTDRFDEIGDIARAAEVFRRHAVEIERLEAAKATATALRESEERLRLIVDTMPVPVVMTRMADHRILFANHQVRVLLGGDADPIGAPTRDFYANPADRDRLLALLGDKGHVDSFEAELLHADGSSFWGLISAAPTTYRGEPVLLAGVYDISDRRRIEDQVKEARDRAEAATRAKSEFLATMSHEIRTPMNGVIGMTQLLREGQLNPEQREQVEALCSSGKALQSLLNDILDLSKLESGKVQLTAVTFDLERLVREAVTLLQGRAEERVIALTYRLEAGVPAWVRGDDLRLRQVLLNLVGNAVKFTEDGKVSVIVRNVVASEPSMLRFEVVDSGIGIPPEQLTALFQPFSQGGDAVMRRFGGTGLGLAICKRLVELQGGTIGVVSAPGEGSTFWFELPLAHAMPAVGTQAGDKPPGTPEGQALRILLAEDNVVNQKVVAAYFKRRGHEVTVVADGAQAVERAGAQCYDIVLMDMQMPVMDGIEATRAIRQLARPHGAVPIVALTANAFQEDAEKCLAAGMNDFVSKPVDFEALSGIIARLARP